MLGSRRREEAGELTPTQRATLIANALAVVLWGIGFAWSLSEQGLGIVAYYTQLSNAVAAFSASLLVLSLLATGATPNWVRTLRYLSACMLTMTFLVTLFVLVPLGSSLRGMFFEGSGLYHHLLCPVITVVAYAVLEPKTTVRRPWVAMVAVTLTYGLLMLLLNVWNLYRGPYPFLEVHDQSLVETLIWFVVLVASAQLIGMGFSRLPVAKSRAR